MSVALLEAAARAVLDAYRARGLMLATAESCTGGLVSAALTEIAGSSDVLERAFVTYSNAAKTAMLGVEATLIEQFGAVSEPVARAMATGALSASPVDVCVSITGVAGPGGGTATKPVGTVWLATARRGGGVRAEVHRFPGDRKAVRLASAARALAMLLEAAG